jgi:hypothetical protein
MPSNPSLVLIFSSHANASRQIRREVERAVSKGLTIVPVRIDQAQPMEALAYFMAGVHWLDALTPPLEKHLQQLAISIKAFLRTPQPQPPVGPEPSKSEPTTEHQPRRPSWRSIIMITVASALIALTAWLVVPFRHVPNQAPLGNPPPADTGTSLTAPKSTPLITEPRPLIKEPRSLREPNIGQGPNIGGRP